MMETTTILAELAKINDCLSGIEARLNDMQLDIAILRNAEIKTRPDKYKSWPLDSDLDAEEAEELRSAKENASEEWKSLNNNEKFIRK